MNASHERPRVWSDLSTLMALCAATRLVFVWLVPRVLDSADAVAYLEAARRIAAGEIGWLDPKIPVLYPALVALAHQFIPDIESAGRAVSWIASTLLVVPVYLLTRTLHGRSTALVAGTLIAFWPWLIDYGSRVATEPVAVLVFLCGVFALVRGWDPVSGAGWMLAAGAGFGLLHLCRAEGTFVYLGALLALPILRWRSVDRPAVRLAAFAAPGLIALVIGALVTHAVTGGWTLNYRVGFIGEQPEGSTVLRDFARTLVAMSADVPAVMLGPLLWAFFGAGLLVAGPHPRDARREVAVLYFALLQWLVVLPVLSPAPRYLMAPFVILAIWSARGIDRASVLAASRARSLRAVPLALVLGWMVFHLAVAVVADRIADPPRQPWEYKSAGEWMRTHLDPAPILTRKPQVGFYANMPTVGLPADADLDAIHEIADNHGARYLVVDERYTAQLVPAMKPLLDVDTSPSAHGLRALHVEEMSSASTRLVVYGFIDTR